MFKKVKSAARSLSMAAARPFFTVSASADRGQTFGEAGKEQRLVRGDRFSYSVRMKKLPLACR
jgi:hypothetical protein